MSNQNQGNSRGGSHEQHVQAGQQSHKNDQQNQSSSADPAAAAELRQQVHASDLVVHSSNGLTGWSANERSDGGMGALYS